MSNKVLEAGISVKCYNTGQCSGVAYTVAAHSEISIEFDLKMECVSPSYTEGLNDMVYSLLNDNKKTKYKDLAKKAISGGISFVPFFGTSRASCQQTKNTLDSWELNEINQTIIMKSMLSSKTSWNTFHFKGIIDNKHNDHAVTGTVYYIFMNCQVTIDENSVDQRYTAPDVHFQGSKDEILPIIGKLYGNSSIIKKQ